MGITTRGYSARGVALAIAVALVIVALLLGFAGQAQASTSQASLAPVNSGFLQFMQARTTNVVPLRTSDGRALGALPSPRDSSLTRGMRVGGLVGTLPSSYDLRAYGRVTPVRDQNPYGTCWSFATYGSLESCLLPGENRDFSEDNLVLTSGYGALGDPATDLYDMGGNYLMSTAYLARWGGPVYESDDAYGDGSTPSGLTVRKHVQQVDWLPGRGSPTNNDDVKNAVMSYGGVYVTMYWAGSSGGSTYYKASTSSYYYYGSSTSGNHAVLIVGWNDSYAASNFATTPAGNGAFLVKNSWGTGWGSSGYFWVSYYDTVFGRNEEMAIFDNASSTSNYTGIYQYDPLGCTTSLAYPSTSSYTGWFGSVFTAQATTTVTAVGFYTLYPNTSYEVYTGSTLAGKTLNTSGTQPYMGYHTVTLATPRSITSGQSFAVALKVVTPASVTGDKYPIAIEYPIPGYSEKAAASSGQSYVSSTGTSWADLSTQYSNTNVCLKAYTGGGSVTTYTLATSVASGSGTITRSPDQATYNSGDVVTLTANPATGYTFTGWGGGASGTTNPLSVTMNANKTITATFTASGPSATRYEQTNSYLVYSGTWITSSSSLYSGGSYKYVNSLGAKVTATFTGTAITYIARTGTNQGIAKVTLDGTSTLVDLYSTATKYKQAVWSATGLTEGTTHTLVIERNGTKRSASSSYQINLDALDIVGTLTTAGPTTYTLTTSVASGSGTIGRSPDRVTYNSGDVVTLTATPASGYTFTGWGGNASGTTNPLSVTMNANKTITATFTSDSGPTTYTLTTSVASGSGTIGRSPDQVTYNSGDVVTLTATPASGYTFTGWGGNASGTTNPLTVTMNANKTITATFTASGGGTTRYEETNPLLVYAGNWLTGTGTLYSGGTYKYTNYLGARVTATFTGTAVSYIARTGATAGKVRITLDGVSTTVDLYSAGSVYKKTVWSATGLGSGTHTLVIEFTGTHNSSSPASTVNLDALDITGGTLL